MIYYVAIVKMGTDKSFIHLIKCLTREESGKVFDNSEILLLAFMIFSLKYFLKDQLESSMRPKCFCSFILATTVPLNITCGWFGLDYLQENKTSVACLIESGLNSNFH